MCVNRGRSHIKANLKRAWKEIEARASIRGNTVPQFISVPKSLA